MSNTKKGSPKFGSIPKAFKCLQNRSQKMKIKENAKYSLTNPEKVFHLRIRKTHAWVYF